MPCHFRIQAPVALVLLAAAASPAMAAESYDNCTGFIDALPAVITTQGTWCLRKDLSTAVASGHAITIATNNVTLDCNDFKVGGLAAGAGTGAIGVMAVSRINLVVRNCSIRGFRFGLWFYSSPDPGTFGGHLVEDNRFEANTQGGINVSGDGSIIRRNMVSDTGGSTVSSGAEAITGALSVDIIDNTVFNVTAKGAGFALGIGSWDNPGGSIIGNRVRGLVHESGGGSHGIWHANGGNTAMRNNELTSAAVAGSAAIACTQSGDPVDRATTKGNLVNGFATAFVGCSNDSGNVVNP